MQSDLLLHIKILENETQRGLSIKTYCSLYPCAEIRTVKSKKIYSRANSL